MSGPDVVLVGNFDAEHERRYAHIPFRVPSGVRALRISYDYSDRISSDPMVHGGNTLDIGLFDERGIAPGSPGFRGWSGSSKLEFSVTETWATPPYLAGPIAAGTWHVLLGPYKVGPHGCEYRVEITFGPDPGEPESRPLQVFEQPGSRSPVAEPGWLHGDLHCHTLHSDGDSWPRDMLASAVQRGLDFLGVTDHNQTAHQAEYARVTGQHLPIILPGIEVTTYGGHWNAWGTDRWWEFREPTAAATSQAMRAAAASGALVSVNHPKPLGPAWEYPEATGYHAIEVWNGDWQRLNHVSLAWWEQHLRRDIRVVALGGSDTHRLKAGDLDPRHGRRLGVPTTWACTGGERSSEAVLAALRAGRVFISRDVDGPQLYLEQRHNAVGVHAVDAAGAALLLISDRGIGFTNRVTSSDWADTLRLSDEVRYVRAQLIDEYGQLLALTNPLYARQ